MKRISVMSTLRGHAVTTGGTYFGMPRTRGSASFRAWRRDLLWRPRAVASPKFMGHDSACHSMLSETWRL